MGEPVIGAVVAGTVAAVFGGLVAAVNRRLWRTTPPCDHIVGSVAVDGDQRDRPPGTGTRAAG